MNNIRIQLTLPPDVLAFIDKRKDVMGLSRSGYISNLVARQAEVENLTENLPELLSTMKSAINEIQKRDASIFQNNLKSSENAE